MGDHVSDLKTLLGENKFGDVACQGEDDNITNSKDIYCACKTLILRSKQAKLMTATESMQPVEHTLTNVKFKDRFFDDITKGCYWMIDDMYKFEQMGYSKIVPNNPSTNSSETNGDQPIDSTHDSSNTKKELADGLRYLCCADCNVGPLGWFDSKTKESYLFVW